MCIIKRIVIFGFIIVLFVIVYLLKILFLRGKMSKIQFIENLNKSSNNRTVEMVQYSFHPSCNCSRYKWLGNKTKRLKSCESRSDSWAWWPIGMIITSCKFIS